MIGLLAASVLVALAYAYRLGHDAGRRHQRARQFNLGDAVLVDLGRRSLLVDRLTFDLIPKRKHDADQGRRAGHELPCRLRTHAPGRLAAHGGRGMTTVTLRVGDRVRVDGRGGILRALSLTTPCVASADVQLDRDHETGHIGWVCTSLDHIEPEEQAMPVYTFQCDTCGTTDPTVLMTIDEYVDAYPCTSLPDCSGEMRRRFAGQAPAIGAVPGGGGSPSRTGSRQ
jgi:predicted nucleic acid-binding Zn ribbon protein